MVEEVSGYCFKCKKTVQLKETHKVEVDAQDEKWKRMKGKEMIKGKCGECSGNCSSIRGLKKTEAETQVAK